MKVFVGLGSNIEPEKNLRLASSMLKKKFPGIGFSSVYRSTALERNDQDDFLNAAAVFDTDLSMNKVSTILQEIEHTLKKDPPFRFGPRTIDLDLLLYGKEVSHDKALTVPHPRLHLRRFVLEPLIELGAGELKHPVFGRALKVYLSDVADQSCEKVEMKL